MTLLCPEQFTLAELSDMSITLRDCDSLIYTLLPDIATAEYLDDTVECVYTLKQELVEIVPVFSFFANIWSINTLIEVFFRI